MSAEKPQHGTKDKREDRAYNPLVSIITPVLNGVKYLEACIESVLSQSYPHVEHVIVDGGSTDGTVDVLSSYGTKYPDRVRFISEPDEGRDVAANKGVQMAKGEIFEALGSDDMLEPGAIQTVVEFFRANPDAYFVFGDCNYVDAKGNVIKRCRYKDFSLKKTLNDKMFMLMGSAFYKRAVFEKIGLYYVAPEATLICDFDFVIRAGKVFQIHRIEEVLYNFRIRKVLLTGNSWERDKMIMRACYITSRHYGGSIFSGHFRRYCAYLIIDLLRPVLGPIYPFIEKVLARIYKREGASV